MQLPSAFAACFCLLARSAPLHSHLAHPGRRRRRIHRYRSVVHLLPGRTLRSTVSTYVAKTDLRITIPVGALSARSSKSTARLRPFFTAIAAICTLARSRDYFALEKFDRSDFAPHASFRPRLTGNRRRSPSTSGDDDINIDEPSPSVC